ncbi:MAG: hypothetical protein HY291_09025 [Planctomycetes bacterium]|nr:hypothetical protein [Planctomycetota bacterium]
MRLLNAIFPVCLTCSFLIAPALPAEKAPDEKKVRAQIDECIQAFAAKDKKATLGLLEECLGLSISYGAPSYNNGDRDGCYAFYFKTMTDLVAAFSGEGKATPIAAKELKEFAACLARADKLQTTDDKAWALRFGWDKAAIAWESDAARAAALVDLGKENYFRGHFAAAETALREAAELYPEICGHFRERVPISASMAVMLLAEPLFAQTKFKEAAEALQSGLEALPDWPTYEFNLQQFYSAPATQDALVKKLEAAVQEKPNDAALRLLLGYQYFFTDKKENGQAEFAKTLELDPANVAAKQFRKLTPDSPEQKEIAERLKDLSAEDFDKRQAATDKLKAYGRWAIQALRTAAKTSKDPEVRSRCMELLKPLVGKEGEGE